MDMVNLTQYIGRPVTRLNDGACGKIVELGNYDDDDDLEFSIELTGGETVVADLEEVLMGTTYKLG